VRRVGKSCDWCVVIAIVVQLGSRSHEDVLATFSAGLFYLFWATPLIGLAHVVFVGQDYVEAGLSESKSGLVFVALWGSINLCLWVVGRMIVFAKFHYPA
jgi:ABC-type arginine/histidine transport system permease subunit